MLNNEENTEQKLRDNISTTVEGGTQGWQKQPFQKSKTEKTLQRKIDLMFLPLVLFIIMVEAKHYKISHSRSFAIIMHSISV